MVVLRSRLKFGKCAFSIAAPRAWNSIPAGLRATLNTAAFKKNLKTFLFRESHSSFWLNSCVTFALLHCQFLFLVYCIFLWSGWSDFAVSPSRLSLSLSLSSSQWNREMSCFCFYTFHSLHRTDRKYRSQVIHESYSCFIVWSRVSRWHDRVISFQPTSMHLIWIRFQYKYRRLPTGIFCHESWQNDICYECCP